MYVSKSKSIYKSKSKSKSIIPICCISTYLPMYLSTYLPIILPIKDLDDLRIWYVQCTSITYLCIILKISFCLGISESIIWVYTFSVNKTAKQLLRFAWISKTYRAQVLWRRSHPTGTVSILGKQYIQYSKNLSWLFLYHPKRIKNRKCTTMFQITKYCSRHCSIRFILLFSIWIQGPRSQFLRSSLYFLTHLAYSAGHWYHQFIDETDETQQEQAGIVEFRHVSKNLLGSAPTCFQAIRLNGSDIQHKYTKLN